MKEDRAWVAHAIHIIEADFNRSADTHLLRVPLPEHSRDRPVPQGRVDASHRQPQAPAGALPLPLRPLQRLDPPGTPILEAS